MTNPRLTQNQREALLRLCRAIGTDRERWIAGRDLGQPVAFEHLRAKGYVVEHLRYGPRGGELRYYRPTEIGWQVRDRAVARSIAERHPDRMSTGAIDSILCNARKAGTIVSVCCGSPAYVRGYVGEIGRDDRGHLVLQIGQRRIVLATITKVEAS